MNTFLHSILMVERTCKNSASILHPKPNITSDILFF